MNALFPASLEAKGDSPSQNPETRNQDQQKHERKTKHDDVQLNQKYTGNKLERARKSMKWSDSYRFIIESTGGLEEVTARFSSGNSIAPEVKKVGENLYRIRLSARETRFSQEFQKAESGVVPGEIEGYSVVQPELVEALASPEYFSGESISQLWWIEKLWVWESFPDTPPATRVKVGILDTGIDATHADLAQNYNTTLSYDFISGASGAIDDNGHGTQVVWVLGAAVNGAGVFGVNPNANLIALKVLDANGLGTTYDVLEALAYAGEQHIPVVNMSFGGLIGDPDASPICQAITNLRNNGTITVVAAGNAGQELTNTLPAACSDAITVGASAQDGSRTSFSNYGTLVDITAPWVDMYTTTLAGGYTTKNGTSFSAPIIAGLVARELEQNPSITYEQILSNLQHHPWLGLGSWGVVTSSGITTSSWETQSWATASGLLNPPPPPIDYSTYRYYSGIFQQGGIIYGNSLYPDTMDFSGANLGWVQIYSYSEYQNILQSLSGSFQAMSVPTNGLIGEWKLNGNANDTSGVGNNGVPTNVTWVDSGRWDGKLVASFNGTGSIIENTWAIELNRSSGQELTVNLWMKWAGWNYYENLVTIRWPAWHNWIFYLHDTGNTLSFHSKTSQNRWSYTPPVSQWIMATATVDSWWVLRVYANGVLKDTFSWYTFGTNYSNFLRIGWSTSEYYKWQLSDIRIYNRVLSTSEIQDLYNDGTGTTVSNNTSNPYTNSFFAANPNLTFLPNSGADNFVWNSNSRRLVEGIDSWVNEKMANNLWDPVHLATGEFTYDNTLMSVPGVGLPYELKVQYKNQVDYNGPLGFNWDHNYNQYLSGETNGNVLYSNGQLGTFRFIKSGSVFLRNDGLRATLIQSGSTYAIQYEDGNTTTFNTSNRVSQIRDIHGNALNFTYSGSYLSGVTDTLGRTMSYTYYDHNRLRTVTDFSGRKTDFAYYTGATASGNLYDLKNITLTNGTGATKTIGFEYSTTSSGTLAHNLTRLIDAKGQVYVTNTYDTGDHVATQKYGTGTLTYTYTLSGSAITKNTVIDRLGHKTEYSYDASGNNTSIKYYNPSQTSSVIYSYEYNTSGLITKETRPRGNGYFYSYDGSGNLLMKTERADITTGSANDIITSYIYNARNERTSETLPTGKNITYTRDGQGNVTTKTTSSTSATGFVTLITTNSTYLSNGLLSTITSPEGKLTRYTYSGGQVATLTRGTNSETSTGSFTTTAYGRILTATDGDNYTKTSTYTPWDLLSTGTTSEGIITSYAYDANNNKIRETRYLSWGVSMDSYYSYDDLDHLTGSLIETSEGQTVLTSYTYDANGNIKSKKVGNGATTTYTYNEFSKPTEERILLVPGDSSKDIVTTYTYDTNNNFTSKTDPRGSTTTYTYDLYDRLTQVTNPDGSSTTTSYNKDDTIDTVTTYTSSGTILTKTRTLYDGLTHPTKTITYLDPANSTGAVETSIVYTRDFEQRQLIDAKNNTTTNSYDTRGNLTTVTDALGNQQTTTYNKRDLRTSATTTPTSGNVTTTSYTYDHDGRLTVSTNGVGKSQTKTYNQLGYVTSTTDEQNRLTTYTRDYRGLPLTSTEYASGQAITTTMTYDDRANLTTVTDPELHTTTYEYDGINRNTKVTYPDATTTNYIYDKSSNLTTKTDANGTTTTNSYDNRNRLTSRTLSTGSGVTGVTSESYAYDQLNRLTSGTNSQSGNQIASLSWNYDAMSRPMSESQTVSGSTKTVWYAYDNNGNLTTLTHPDGQIQSYTYDALNRNTTVGYSGQTIATYGFSGLTLANLAYNNTRTTNYTYDSLQRLSNINPNTASIPTESLTYDDSSLITADGTKSYAYDNLKRLISAAPTSTGSINQNIESYTYDKTGNRKTDTTNTIGTNYATNLLDQYTSQTGGVNKNYTYDANGNLKSDGTKSFIYDYQNHLVQVTQSGITLAQYQYDVLGRRVQKTTPTESIIYVYAGDNIVQEIKNIWGLVLKKEYINGIGTDSLIAYDAQESTNQDKISFCQIRVLPYQTEFNTYGYSSIISDCNATISSNTGVTTKRYFYHTNYLGSVVGLTDNSGNVLQTYAYDSFGKAYPVTGSGTLTAIDSSTNLYGNTRLFTWREYDREASLYFNRARYYNPETGRFISRDPIGQRDQINLYTYVKNSPLVYTDRMGLSSKPFIIRAWEWIADVFIYTVLWVDTANAPWESNYDEIISKWKILQDKVDNPTGLDIAASIAFPFPWWGKNKLIDGAIMKVDDALTAAEKFLWKWYKELSNWRFVSEDWLKQVRMGMSDILWKHGGWPHINFEKLDANWKLIPDSKIHIFLND